ncbi:MAG: glycosyltransferase family 2 protein [Halothiobacillaceae bacterium]|nr:glycosyltransferase family 2 protein [Halothiobacillaceae bacterium]
MSEAPLVPVSVIVPCYRCVATIGRAVDSILAQTMRPAEIILVDDASGDGTLDKLRAIRDTYGDWARIIELPTNLGAASARNAGWALATQPFVAFLDADDSWHPEKLRIQHEYMARNPSVALCGHRIILLPDGHMSPVPPANPSVTPISASSLLFRNAFSTPTVVLKRDLPFRFREGARYAEDFMLWQQIACSGLGVVRLESPLAYVHKPFYGAGGLSAKLWEMEKGELGNLAVLYKGGCIQFHWLGVAVIFSIGKFARRALVTVLKRAWTISMKPSSSN